MRFLIGIDGHAWNVDNIDSIEYEITPSTQGMPVEQWRVVAHRSNGVWKVMTLDTDLRSAMRARERIREIVEQIGATSHGA